LFCGFHAVRPVVGSLTTEWKPVAGFLLGTQDRVSVTQCHTLAMRLPMWTRIRLDSAQSKSSARPVCACPGADETPSCLCRMVRPIITYWFMALYCAAKTAAFTAALNAGADWGQAVIAAWTDADQALWSGVLNFWFLGRVFERVKQCPRSAASPRTGQTVRGLAARAEDRFKPGLSLPLSGSVLDDRLRPPVSTESSADHTDPSRGPPRCRPAIGARIHAAAVPSAGDRTRIPPRRARGLRHQPWHGTAAAFRLASSREPARLARRRQ